MHLPSALILIRPGLGKEHIGWNALLPYKGGPSHLDLMSIRIKLEPRTIKKQLLYIQILSLSVFFDKMII